MFAGSPYLQKVVWVIDDDEIALLLAHEVLTANGFSVRTFQDAAAALDVATAALPALVVVDLIMPGTNGFEFCSRLRQMPQGALTPILVVTSLDDADSINQAYQAGATNFATKPLNWAIEVKRLNYLLKSAELAYELRRKEQETRLAKEDWERTFNSISDSVMILDPDHKIIRANAAAARLLDRSVESILGCSCHDLFQCKSKMCPSCPAFRAQTTNQPVTVEGECGLAETMFEVSVSPVTEPGQATTHLVHVIRDMSEHKRLEAELRQAQKMEAVGTLAGGIAHDFNNLLTIIQGYGELLRVEIGQPNADLQAVLAAARRGSALAKQLLVFSRKSATITRKQPLNLHEPIRNVIKMLERGIAKNISLNPDPSDNLRPVFVNPEQIEQVLMNLAVNATHAMPHGGELTFQTRNFTPTPDFLRSCPGLKPGDYVRLTVADTGHGMSKQVLERIYEPFFTTKKVGEGTGLGLSVVFGIVQEHAGYIACESEVGVGTKFMVYLPAASQPQDESQAAPAEQSPLPGGSETILVVDDEVQICNLVQRGLTDLGYKVVTAQDGEMALDKYKNPNFHPDAVVLDLGMPKMDGWKCLAELRRMDPQVKVLIATGYGGDNLEAEAGEKGASGLLVKPYQWPDVCKALRDVLDTPNPSRAY